MAFAVTDGGTVHSVERGPVDLPRDEEAMSSNSAASLVRNTMSAVHWLRTTLLSKPARLALVTLHQKEQTDPDGTPLFELPHVA